MGTQSIWMPSLLWTPSTCGRKAKSLLPAPQTSPQWSLRPRDAALLPCWLPCSLVLGCGPEKSGGETTCTVFWFFFLKKLYTFATFSPGLHKNHFMKQPRLNSFDAPSPAPSCLDLITKRGEAKPCRVEVGKKSKAGSSDCCPHASNGQAASLTFLGREC